MSYCGSSLTFSSTNTSLYPKLVVADLEGEGVASFSGDSLVSFDPPDAKPAREVMDR